VHYIRSLINEIMGEENFIADIIFRKTSGQASEYIAGVYDHVYGLEKIKTKQNIELFLEFLEKMFQTVHTIVSKKQIQLASLEAR